MMNDPTRITKPAAIRPIGLHQPGATGGLSETALMDHRSLRDAAHRRVCFFSVNRRIVNALRARAHYKRATGEARPLPFFLVNWRTSRVADSLESGRRIAVDRSVLTADRRLSLCKQKTR